MMMNLFSVFDPTSYFNLSLNWFIMIIVLMFMPSKYFFVKSSYLNILSLLFLKLKQIYNEVSMPHYSALSFISIFSFVYIMVSNLLGLFPFIFTSTAHPMITISLGLMLWISFFLMGLIQNFQNLAAHLVPEGSPLVLSPLMVCIESISHLIRPFTLSIRLAANMMAGHLIIGLLSSVSLINIYSFSFSLFFQSVLMLLEFGVSIIQGFVFSILLLLYALEYY